MNASRPILNLSSSIDDWENILEAYRHEMERCRANWAAFLNCRDCYRQMPYLKHMANDYDELAKEEYLAFDAARRQYEKMLRELHLQSLDTK